MPLAISLMRSMCYDLELNSMNSIISPSCKNSFEIIEPIKLVTKPIWISLSVRHTAPPTGCQPPMLRNFLTISHDQADNLTRSGCCCCAVGSPSKTSVLSRLQLWQVQLLHCPSWPSSPVTHTLRIHQWPAAAQLLLLLSLLSRLDPSAWRWSGNQRNQFLHPSAGSPTETLLRLHPLNDEV